MKKYLLTSLVVAAAVLLVNSASARTYYLNSRIGSDKNDGSAMRPLKSIKHLNEMQFFAGDRILFSKGCTFSGAFSVKSSGNSERPIIISAYGLGDKPVLSNPSIAEFNGNVIQISGSYIIIRNIRFRRPSFNQANITSETKALENKDAYLKGAIYQISGSNFLDITDCEFQDCKIGVNLNGQHDLISRNYFEASNCDLSLTRKPIAIVVGNSFYEIVNNRCLNYTNESADLDSLGGFLAIDNLQSANPIHNLKVLNNYLRNPIEPVSKYGPALSKVHSLF